MKPEAALNELDHLVSAATADHGHEFLGAEFAEPENEDSTRVMLKWHARINGKHAVVGVLVEPSVLDDAAIVLVVAGDAIHAMDTLAKRDDG